MELPLSVRTPDGRPRDLFVEADSAHQVADLAAALARHLHGAQTGDAGAPSHLWREGEQLPGASSLVEVDLQAGDELWLLPTSDVPPVAWDGAHLVATGGPRAGQAWALPAGQWILGRDPSVDLAVNDAFVSRRHLQVDVTATGTVTVNDLGSANGTTLDGDRIAGPTTLVTGAALELGASQLRLAEPGSAVTNRIDPDAIKLPTEAPVGANALERRGLRRRELDVASIRGQLDARVPDLPVLVDALRSGTPIPVGRTDRVVRVGFGERRLAIGRDTSTVAGCPLTVDLDDVGDVACAGADPDGLARAIVVQLVLAHEPADLTLLVAGSRQRHQHWRWAEWLPHARMTALQAANGPAHALAFDVGEAAALVRAITSRAANGRGPTERHRFVAVVDASLPWTKGDLPDADALRAAGILVIWIGTPPRTAQVHLVPSSQDGSITIVGPDASEQHGSGADHLDVETARDVALILARRHRGAHDRMPRQVALASVLGPVGVDDLTARWQQQQDLTTEIGLTDTGPVSVTLSPLARHLAIAGAPNSGRSTALRTVVAGLAAAHPPDRLGLVLVGEDQRAHGPLTDLPHVVAVVRGGPSSSLGRVLEAELDRRQALLRKTGAVSLPGLRLAGAGDVPPMIVVAVHRLDGAASQMLRRVLGEGPEADIHVVATLTAPDGRSQLAMFGNRLQLQATDDTESMDMLGTLDGTRLGRDGAGRAWVRLADGIAVPAQIAAATVPSRQRDQIQVMDRDDGRPSADRTATAVARPAQDAHALLADLVEAAKEAAAARPTADWSGLLAGEVDDARQRHTFMFTDIVGSTDLVKAIGDAAWTQLLDWHDVTLRDCFRRHGGHEVDNAGDGFFVAFSDPRSGVDCAVDIQRRLQAHREQAGFAPQVRIGVHEAEAHVEDSRFTGHGVHEAARVGSVGTGSEIVSSMATARLAGASTTKSRLVELKGVPEPMELVSISWRD